MKQGYLITQLIETPQIGQNVVVLFAHGVFDGKILNISDDRKVAHVELEGYVGNEDWQEFERDVDVRRLLTIVYEIVDENFKPTGEIVETDPEMWGEFFGERLIDNWVLCEVEE